MAHAGQARHQSKEHYLQILAEHTRKLNERQSPVYAHHRYALLLIFQAMDAAGKDGAIKQVMSGINPQGCEVFRANKSRWRTRERHHHEKKRAQPVEPDTELM